MKMAKQSEKLEKKEDKEKQRLKQKAAATAAAPTQEGIKKIAEKVIAPKVTAPKMTKPTAETLKETVERENTNIDPITKLREDFDQVIKVRLVL